MTTNLLLLTSGIYAWVAYGFARERRWGMAIAFVCYALANVGFALDAMKPPSNPPNP
jgi:uncharacterized membrane protein (UPF0136 family)